MGIFDIFGTQDQQNAANAQNAGIQTGLSSLTGNVNNGSNALQTNYANALAPFTQNYGTASGGQNQLASLLGIGPQGSAGIQSTLQNLPGYQFTLDQGTQNVLRNQAATGQLNSGATDVALQNYGQGTASQNYNNYVSQLQPFLGAANSAASGVAGVNTGLGNALNANDVLLGNANYGANTSMGNNTANADLAGLTASGNLFSLFGGLGKAALGTGGLFGTSGLIPGLSNFMGGGYSGPTGNIGYGTGVGGYGPIPANSGGVSSLLKLFG
jgi:hypothetical protein